MKTLFVLISVALCVGLVWGVVQGRENKQPSEITTVATTSTVVETTDETSTSSSSSSSQTSRKEFLPDEKWVEANISIPKEIPEFIPGPDGVMSAAEAKEAYMCDIEPTYRIRYYEISAFFSDLVDSREAELWGESRRFVENLPEEMSLVSFVKYFQIPKETFKKAAKEEVQRFIESVA